MIATLSSLPFTPPAVGQFDGRRESNNATRVYFTPAIQSQFAVSRDLVEVFSHPDVVTGIVDLTGADLGGARLRIEYCQDTDGFWLEPHCDIAVKRFTMLIYLSDDPALHDAGTDIYDDTAAHKRVASVPYRQNAGLIFIPGDATWHGFSPRPIRGLRTSLIINYVAAEWRATDELANPDKPVA